MIKIPEMLWLENIFTGLMRVEIKNGKNLFLKTTKPILLFQIYVASAIRTVSEKNWQLISWNGRGKKIVYVLWLTIKVFYSDKNIRW